MAFLNLKEMENVTFGLINEVASESYAIWNNNTRQFIRKGEIQGTSTDPNTNVIRTFDVGDTKYMTKPTFEKEFPGCRKVNKIKREVTVDGMQYTWEMPKTVNDKILQIIATARGLGKTPLELLFLCTWKGEGIAKRYEVELVSSDAPAPTQAPTEAPKITIGEPEVKEELVLADNESELVDAIKDAVKNNNNGTMYAFEQISDNFKAAKIEPTRALQIYNEVLK